MKALLVKPPEPDTDYLYLSKHDGSVFSHSELNNKARQNLISIPCPQMGGRGRGAEVQWQRLQMKKPKP